MGPEAEDHVGRSSPPGRLQCPFCNAYDVARLYVASLKADACECATCGARWDEERDSGQYLGGSEHSSILVPRKR